MVRRSSRRILGRAPLWACLLGGCSAEIVAIDPPAAQPGERAEILALHDGGALTLYALPRDAPFGLRLEVGAPDAEVESLLLGGSLEELGLPAGRLLLAGEGPSRGIPRPARALRGRLAADGAVAWREVAATEISPEVRAFQVQGASCARLSPEGLRPYAAAPIAVSAEDDGARSGEGVEIRKVVAVATDRSLVLTDRAIHLVLRGRAYPAGARFVPQAPPRDLAYEPASGRAWVVGGQVLTELVVTGEALRVERELPLPIGCIGGTEVLVAVVALPGQTWVANDRGATCYFDGSTFVGGVGRIELMGFEAGVGSMIGTHEPLVPLLAAGGTRVFEYTRTSSVWLALDAGLRGLIPIFTPKVLASIGVGAARSSWAGGGAGWLFQKPDRASEWVVQSAGRDARQHDEPLSPPLRWPQDYSRCAAGNYPVLVEEDAITALAVLDDHLLLASEFCPALVELDITELRPGQAPWPGPCSLTLSASGADAPPETTSFRAIAVQDDAVLAGGSGGYLYLAQRAPGR